MSDYIKDVLKDAIEDRAFVGWRCGDCDCPYR